jgi:hypothetical protein
VKARQSEPVTGAGAAPHAVRASTAAALWIGLRPRITRLRFALVVIVAVGLVAAGQIVEDLADSPPLQMAPPDLYARRWTVIVAVLYMLLTANVLDRTVQRSIPSLQRVLKIDADTFRGYALAMRPPGLLLDVALLGASALIAALLFAVVQLDLPTGDPLTRQPRFLPTDGLGALFVLGGYTIVGWAGLRLVYGTVRMARVLGRMSRQPLQVDIFDTSSLLPFGNIALGVALAPAGIIAILLLGLGQPGTPLGWTILFLAASASLLALLLPLRGIHRQMSRAKEAALASLNERISHAYEETTGTPVNAAPDMTPLNARVNTLVPLRKTVQEMTTWPFRDTVAFGRAVLIASAPLIYTALSELIRVFWITPLAR